MLVRMFLFLLLCSTVACQPPEEVDGCGPEALIATGGDLVLDSLAAVSIIDYKLKKDCFEVTIGASGCNSDNWELAMIGGAVAESLPPQRTIHFRLKNPEACLAYFTRTFTFDVRPLQENGGAVWLILQDTKDDKGEVERVLYEF